MESSSLMDSIFWNKIQPYKPCIAYSKINTLFITLCFITFFFFNKLKGGGSLFWAGTLVSFPQICSLCVIFWWFSQSLYFSLLCYLLWCSVISNLWGYYYDSLEAQMMVSFFQLVFFKVCTLLFRHDAVAHLINYNIV